MDKNKNCKETDAFQRIMRDSKHHDTPSFEGVHVLLVDPESQVTYRVPVNLIDSISNVPTGYNRPVVQVKLKTGDAYFAAGSMTEVLGQIIEAKIKGGCGNE